MDEQHRQTARHQALKGKIVFHGSEARLGFSAWSTAARSAADAYQWKKKVPKVNDQVQFWTFGKPW